MTDNQAKRRSDLVTKLNVLEHDLQKAAERVDKTRADYQKVINDAKAQLGTACAEHNKILREFTMVRNRLVEELQSTAALLRDADEELGSSVHAA